MNSCLELEGFFIEYSPCKCFRDIEKRDIGSISNVYKIECPNTSCTFKLILKEPN